MVSGNLTRLLVINITNVFFKLISKRLKRHHSNSCFVDELKSLISDSNELLDIYSDVSSAKSLLLKPLTKKIFSRIIRDKGKKNAKKN